MTETRRAPPPPRQQSRPQRQPPPPPSARKTRALATRRRMLEAAYALFCERGYAATTMRAIATRAGVAYQTLYFTFSSKAAMLSEVFGACVVGFEHWTPELAGLGADGRSMATRQPWWSAFAAESEPGRALAIFVEASLTILERVGPLVEVAITAAAADPEMAVWRADGEARRIAAYQFVAARLARKGGLRPGLGVARARDVLLVLLSGEVHGRLVARGWSRADCRDWLLTLLEHELLAPTGRAARRQRGRGASRKRAFAAPW